MSRVDDEKQDRKERLRARMYWLVYPLILLITALHINDSLHQRGGSVKAWIAVGAAFMVLAVLRHIFN
jgi:hypothetical protein